MSQPDTAKDEVDRPRYAAFGVWVGALSDGCTCGPDDYGHHEKFCGWEQVVQLYTEQDAALMVELLNR